MSYYLEGLRDGAIVAILFYGILLLVSIEEFEATVAAVFVAFVLGIQIMIMYDIRRSEKNGK